MIRLFTFPSESEATAGSMRIYRERYILPTDAGHRHAIINALQREIQVQPMTLTLHEMGIWPSSEIPELYRRIRLSQGLNPDYMQFNREELTAPEPSELSYMFAAVSVALSNFWSFSLLLTTDKTLIYLSHDEWAGYICTDDDSRRNESIEELFAILT